MINMSLLFTIESGINKKRQLRPENPGKSGKLNKPQISRFGREVYERHTWYA